MAWSEEYCAEMPAPTITPPDITPDSSLTKEQLLNILGYTEIVLSKTDVDGTATVVVPGVAAQTGG